MMARTPGPIELHRRRRERVVGIPFWILALQCLTGAALALIWLLTLRWQLQCIVDAAHLVRP